MQIEPDTQYDSTQETKKHIDRVRQLIWVVTDKLKTRSFDHDRSKLADPEKAAFDIATPKLAHLTYGTPEYQQSLNDIKPALEHHYSVNSHHPQHFENSVNGMTLLDVIEMFCDWKAASERGKGNNFMEGLPYSKERFNLSDQLYDILVNTAKELGFDAD